MPLKLRQPSQQATRKMSPSAASTSTLVVVGGGDSTQRSIDTMPYAIDAEISNKGRRFAATKRRVKFSFGFGNLKAMESGLSASECRGQEHEVVMVWSLTSGKQRVLADGVEVHFSRHPVTEKFECTWSMKNGHKIRVVSAWAPLTKDIRQFDLQIDGLSFWEMPKIFQLGQEGLPIRKRAVSNAVSEVPALPSTSLQPPPHQSLQQQECLLDLPFESSRPSDVSTELSHSTSGRPAVVHRAQSAPVTAPGYSPTSVTSVWGSSPYHYPGAQQQLKQHAMPVSLLDTAWPMPTSHFAPSSQSSCHSLQVRSVHESFYRGNDHALDISLHSAQGGGTTPVHEDDMSPMERALRSLVDMNPNPAGYPTTLSRCPSVSDLSVQSAFASTDNYNWETSHWDRRQSMFASPQTHPVFSFAG